MRKIAVLLITLTFLVTTLFSMSFSSAAASHDYATALKYSILFYDANKCGPDAAVDNVFSWRGPCHTTDGSEIGLDLTGGYHDAGDHVKFGLPQAYAAAVLGWSLYEYKGVFDATGNTSKMLSTLKYFTDYLLKCHPDSNTFYYQVGDGQADHTYWGAPEVQPGPRPVPYVANASNAASDVCGLTSAALTIMYLNYKDIDQNYANKCLKAAKELYTMAKTNLGYYAENAFYISHSYWDDLSFAATWLYVVEKDPTYLKEIDSYLSNKTLWGESPFNNKWTMCWDDMYMAVFCKLAEITGEQKYIDAMNYNLDYWMNSLNTTPGGLKYLDSWGVLRYAAAEAFIAMRYYELTKNEALKSFAKSQIDYILGSNPINMSYVIGYGSNYPKCPHHRAANGYTYANGDNAKPAKNLLLGALVGGPNMSDNFIDDVNQFQFTEVAIDYNAAFVGALAAIEKYYGNIVIPTPPATTPPSPTATPSLIWCDVGDLNADGSINSVDITYMKRYLLRSISVLPYQENERIRIPAADTNGDGAINSSDMVLLKRYVLRSISEFPVKYDIYGNVIN
ncbi:glycoside hydrolase family 9 [Acetivibrio thermocellus BC1]|nr:glycoside hydrolase family 9 [Acetivibrio thermocellus BC1]